MNHPGTLPTAIARYLSCGDSDPECRIWPGGYYDRHVLAHRKLRAALVAEVRRRVVGVVPAESPDAQFPSSQRRIELMVRGLFPATEQETVLARLLTSVVLITHANIDTLLQNLTWDRTAWVIANMYLRSLGLETLGGDDSTPVGMSEETTCYVTPECLVDADPFADFVVHEAAMSSTTASGKPSVCNKHVPESGCWTSISISAKSLPIRARPFRASSTALRIGESDCTEAFAQEHHFPVHAVDMPEVIDIVQTAAAARSGWKQILARCAHRRTRA